MDETSVDATAYPDVVADVDSFAEQARRRAETEREVVEWAIDELGRAIDERDVDLDPMLDHGWGSQ